MRVGEAFSVSDLHAFVMLHGLTGHLFLTFVGFLHGKGRKIVGNYFVSREDLTGVGGCTKDALMPSIKRA